MSTVECSKASSVARGGEREADVEVSVSERSDLIRFMVETARDWRGHGACVQGKALCFACYPCRECEDKGKLEAESVDTALCMFGHELAVDPVWAELRAGLRAGEAREVDDTEWKAK